MPGTQPIAEPPRPPLEWKDGKWYRWFLDPDEGWVKSECIPQPEPPVIK